MRRCSGDTTYWGLGIALIGRCLLRSVKDGRTALAGGEGVVLLGLSAIHATIGEFVSVRTLGTTPLVVVAHNV